MNDVDSRFVAGPVGRLDSRWHGPRGGPPVLVLHPHPLFGGTMGSRLVYDITVALAEAGHRVVRFDYRGVGRSPGAYGRGDGETDDALAVWDALLRESAAAGRARTAPAVVGYSFGGGVATRLATLRPVPRLVLLAAPPQVSDSALHPIDDAPRVRCPTAFIVGDQDPFVPVAEARRFASRFAPPARLEVLAGAGHFLEPSRNPQAVAAVLSILASQA